MNFDRDHSKDCAKTAIIGQEVHAGLRALNAVVGMQRKSITGELYTFFDESVLCQVAEVRVHSLLGLCRTKLDVKAVWSWEGVSLCRRLKNPLLKGSIQFHMSGLLGLFVWKQKAITDAPDTQFTRNTKSRAQKSHRTKDDV